MHIAPLLIVCRMWSRCGGWYLLFANGDLLDHERYVWPSRHIKIIDVIDFRLPSEVKSLVPVYRMWRLSENSIIWTQKILAQKLEILLEIGKSQSLARKGFIMNKIQQNNNNDNKSKKKKIKQIVLRIELILTIYHWATWGYQSIQNILF